jgi:heptosyltransferase I
MPAVAGLRREFPEAGIDWAIEDRWAPLLTAFPVADETEDRQPHSMQPLVDRVHRVQMRRWRKAPLASATRRQIGALRSRFRTTQYDHVIDLQGAIRSALLAAASHAKVRAGALHPREFPARWFYNVRAHTPARHVVDQAAEIVSAAVGRKIDPEIPPFPISAEAESWAGHLLQRTPSPFIVINPGAGWGAKCWPAERYRALVRLLANQGVSSLVNAGPGEEELARDVCKGNEPFARMVECTLLQLIALVRRTALFIGGDTGPLHLASALNVPVVAIFGPTDPARNGPYAGRFTVLRSPESKRDHSRLREPEPGLLNITVEQVMSAALELLRVPA